MVLKIIPANINSTQYAPRVFNLHIYHLPDAGLPFAFSSLPAFQPSGLLPAFPAAFFEFFVV